MGKGNLDISEIKDVLELLNQNASQYTEEKLTLNEALEIIQRFTINESNLECAFCQRKVPFLKGKFYFHNFIPLAMGGDYKESNVIPICGYCYLSINS